MCRLKGHRKLSDLKANQNPAAATSQPVDTPQEAVVAQTLQQAETAAQVAAAAAQQAADAAADVAALASALTNNDGPELKLAPEPPNEPPASAFAISGLSYNSSDAKVEQELDHGKLDPTANAAKYHQQAYDAVEEGHLVIVLCGPGVWTSGGHFILWYSNDADKNVYINDPASTKANRVKNTFEVLKRNARYYWICKVPKEVISMTNSEVKALIKSEVEAKANEMIPQYLASLQGSTPSSWAAQAWYSAAKAGVFDGSNPLMYITREQVATVLMRTGQIKALPVPSDIDWEDLNQQA